MVGNSMKGSKVMASIKKGIKRKKKSENKNIFFKEKSIDYTILS